MMSKDRIVSLFLPLALLLSLAIVLAACGTNQTQSSESISTPASTQPATSTPKSPDSVQNCGKIDMSALHRLADAGLAQQAGACFWQASQQCRAATLTFRLLGVDTITSHTFLAEKKEGGCTITDSLSHAIVPRPPTTTTNYTCTGVVNASGALHFTSCGAEGDVIVPLQ